MKYKVVSWKPIYIAKRIFANAENGPKKKKDERVIRYQKMPVSDHFWVVKSSAIFNNDFKKIIVVICLPNS